MEFFLAAYIGYAAPGYRQAGKGALVTAILVMLLDAIILNRLELVADETVLILWAELAARAIAGALLAHWVARRIAARRIRAAARKTAGADQFPTD